jgi:hypothetical protein
VESDPKAGVTIVDSNPCDTPLFALAMPLRPDTTSNNESKSSVICPFASPTLELAESHGMSLSTTSILSDNRFNMAKWSSRSINISRRPWQRRRLSNFDFSLSPRAGRGCTRLVNAAFPGL